MKTLYNVKFTIMHEGCWTEKVNIKVKTIKIDEYNSKKVRVIIASPMNLVKHLESAENVYEIIKFRKLGDGYLIEFIEDKSSSISGKILELSDKVLSYENVVERNTEAWNLIVTNKKILDDFKEKFKINLIQVKKVGISDILGNRLTEKEMNVLKTAMRMGYLDYPRKVKAKEVAEVLGISKQDFLYHLRNALNKLVISSFLG